MAGVKNAGAALEDIRIHVKVKISALWVSVMLCYIYGDYFGLYQPRKLQGMQFAFPLPDEIESEAPPCSRRSCNTVCGRRIGSQSSGSVVSGTWPCSIWPGGDAT